MRDIVTYLTFNGNCRQAMQFYQSCLGGALSLRTLGEAPLSENMPDDMKQCILHATLTSGGITIMATDMVPDFGLIKGNSVSLMLRCESEEQAIKLYATLSNGGMVNQPLSVNEQHHLLGAFKDKFGQHWIVYCSNRSK